MKASWREFEVKLWIELQSEFNGLLAVQSLRPWSLLGLPGEVGKDQKRQSVKIIECNFEDNECGE